MVNQHVFIYPISPFSNTLKIVGVGRFVEQTLSTKCGIELSGSFYPSVATNILSRAPVNVKQLW
jgi:hypothetical protein